MKIKDLIIELEQLDPEMEVVTFHQPDDSIRDLYYPITGCWTGNFDANNGDGKAGYPELTEELKAMGHTEEYSVLKTGIPAVILHHSYGR